ncbi:uncharacterized protein LOC135482961 [Lineus longissimus]|uniref:uncharacterized protein LOC135482961 n=1 Tax=Lineus longissimus TaxID=88925 RepID=UPI00315CC776
MSPKNFMQVYIICVPAGEVNVLSAVALLQRKLIDTYNELLGTILRKCEDAFGHTPSPRICMIDFELAAFNALNNVIGDDTEIKGCFYHLTQSTWRKIQELGLVNLYKEQDEFRHFCGMLEGLAFLPLEDVEDGMTHIRRIAPAVANDLIDYFDTTYVTGPYRNVRAPDGAIHLRRGQSTFPPKLWNVHETTLGGDPRTNNVCEAWNNKFTHMVGHTHPTVLKFIKNLQLEEQSVRNVLAQNAIGNQPRKRVRRAVQEHQRRLQNLCVDYIAERKTMEQFLRDIGHCIRIGNIM